jgi:hypothetical protein
MSNNKFTIPQGVYPEPHELETVYLLSKHGKSIEFIKPNMTKGVRSPDIQMDGLLWEIKSPKGKSKRTIEKQFHRASKQSKNLILDLRRVKISLKKSLSETQRQFKIRRYIKKVIIITKDGKVLTLVK